MSETTRRRCPACGTTPIAGFACVQDYPRLPRDIRKRLVPQPGNSRFAAQIRAQAEADARAWFADNPRDASPRLPLGELGDRTHPAEKRREDV